MEETGHGPQDNAEYKVVKKYFGKLVRHFQTNLTSLVNEAFSQGIVTFSEQDELIRCSKSSETKCTEFLNQMLWKIRYSPSCFQSLIDLLISCDLGDVADELESALKQEVPILPSRSSSKGRWPPLVNPELSSKLQEYPALSQQDGGGPLSENSNKIMPTILTPQQISKVSSRYQENVVPDLNGLIPSQLQYSSVVSGFDQSKKVSSERNMYSTHAGADSSDYTSREPMCYHELRSAPTGSSTFDPAPSTQIGHSHSEEKDRMISKIDFLVTKAKNRECEAKNRECELNKLENHVQYLEDCIEKQSISLRQKQQKLIEQNEQIQHLLKQSAALDHEKMRLTKLLLDAQRNAEKAKKDAFDIEKTLIDSEKQYEENAAQLKNELRKAKEEGVFYCSVVVKENFCSIMRSKRQQTRGVLLQEGKSNRHVKITSKEMEGASGTDCPRYGGGHRHFCTQDNTFSMSDENLDLLRSFEALNLSSSF